MSTQDRPTHTTLYVKTGCPYCAGAREFLAGQNVEFIELDVSHDSQAFAEMKRLSGQDKAPVLVYEGDILSDFDVEELVPFLEKHGAHVDRS